MPDGFPPPKRTYPTPAQFDVLITFYKFHKRMARRPKRPSLREVGLENNMSHLGALSHMEALQQKGYLQQRAIWERRGWELTPKGLARAEKRFRLHEKWRKKYGY